MRCNTKCLLKIMFQKHSSFIYKDKQNNSLTIMYINNICYKCVLSCGTNFQFKIKF